MAEIVGSAFVKIKALTADLSKDIQRGLEKGVADVDVDKAAKHFTEGIADKTSKDLKSGITKGIKDAGDDKSAISHFFSRLFSGNDSADAGKKVGDNFSKGLSKAIDSIPALPTSFFTKFALAGAAAVPLTNIAISLVGQIGLIGEALIGVGAAGAAAFGAVAFAALPLFLAFKDKTPELAAFTEHAKQLSDAWKQVGAETQAHLLPALNRALEKSRVLIPIFATFGHTIGEVAADFVDLFATLLTTGRGLERFSAITDASGRIFRTVLQTVIRLGDILSALFVAALPAAERLTQILEDFVHRLQDSVNAAEGAGILTTTFNHLFDIAVLVFGALGDIVAGLLTILHIGAETSIPLFDSFREFAANFRAFTDSAEGKSRITDVFTNAHAIASAFFALVGEILKTIFSVLPGDAGSTAGIVGGLNAIREAIPGIAETVAGFVTTLKKPLGELAVAFGHVFTAFDKVGGLKLIVGALAGSLELLAEAASLPGVAQLVAVFATLAGVLAVLKSLGIIALLSSIGSAIGVVATLFGATGGVGFVAAITTAAGGAATFGGSLAAAATAAIPFILAAALVAAAIAAVIIVITNFDTIKDVIGESIAFAQEKFSELLQFFTGGGLVDTLQSALSGLGDVLQGVAGIANDLLDTLISVLGDVFLSVLSFIGDQISKVPGLIVDGLTGLGDLIGNAFSSAFDAVFEFFKSLPGRIGAAILNFGPVIAGFILDALIRAIEIGINGMLILLIGIPFNITKALVKVAPVLFKAFKSAFDFVISNLPVLAHGIFDFFTKTLPDLLATALEVVIEVIRTDISNILQFFIDLPGNIVDALASLGETIGHAADTALTTFSNAFKSGVETAVSFIKDLPVTLIGLISSIGAAAAGIGNAIFNGLVSAVSAAPAVLGNAITSVAQALIDVINSMLSFLHDHLRIDLDDPTGLTDGLHFAFPDFQIPNLIVSVKELDIPRGGAFAGGGIFDKATLGVFGEAGREAIIPLTRPRRALELAEKSGLIRLIDQQRGGITNQPPINVTVITPDPGEAARQTVQRVYALTRR